MCVQLHWCDVCIACDCFPLHACVLPLTPWPSLTWRSLHFYPGHRALARPGSSAGQRFTKPIVPVTRILIIFIKVVLVKITRHKNANAIGTAIPQQLRDSQPLYNMYTVCLDKHDTTRSERRSQSPAHSVNGIFCLRFFIYSIKVLVFCSFYEGAGMRPT